MLKSFVQLSEMKYWSSQKILRKSKNKNKFEGAQEKNKTKNKVLCGQIHYMILKEKLSSFEAHGIGSGVYVSMCMCMRMCVVYLSKAKQRDGSEGAGLMEHRHLASLCLSWKRQTQQHVLRAALY